MLFNTSDTALDTFYHLMIQTIIPRPIAWVLSKNPGGSFNVAPFSFFNGVASEPPIIMISVGWKNDDARKDTWVNIDQRIDFVLHLPPAGMGDAVVATSKGLPFDESEIGFARLKTVSMDGWPLPRLEGPKAAFLCQKHKIIEVGDEKQGLILGEINQLWVDDAVIQNKEGRIFLDPKKLDPLCRLGGKEYAALGRVFSINRPK